MSRVGLRGVRIPRGSIMMRLISLELRLLSLNFVAATVGVLKGTGAGLRLSEEILVIAGCESAIGLGLLIRFYRVRGSLTQVGTGRLAG